MKKIRIMFLTLVMILAVASFANAYQVSSSGPLNSPTINFSILNDGPGTINSIEFSLLSPYDIDASFPVTILTKPASVTYSTFYLNLVETNHYAKFGFNFTGFTPSATPFSFNWDPDKVGQPNYGAFISDLEGTLVTLFATEGKYCGQMEIVGNHLAVDFCCFKPVPLPPTMLLLGSGLLGLIGFRRKILTT